MNVDEVLAKMDALDANEEEIQYIIDENLRVISIPPLGVVLGVEGDKDVNSAKFKMVRYYKGIDLSKFEIRINFANANGDLSYYTVKNPTVTDDTLTFEWLVGYLVTKYKGTVRFVVRMIITDSSTGEVQQAFDTTIGEAWSLEGLLVDTLTDEKVYDIVAQLKADLTDHVNNLLETIPEDYNELTKKVEDNISRISQLKEDLGELEIGTKNIFNSRELLNATGWTRNGNSYTGTAGNLGKAYKENNYPISFEPNTKYTISLKALTNGSASTDGIGIQFEFYYTDGTKSVLELLNNTLTETSYVFGTNSQKSISYMRIRHSSGGNNTWVLSEIQIEKGNKTNYVNPFTANDIIAREKIEILESKTNNLEENTEIKTNEVKAEIDDLVVQSNNLIIAVGIDNVKNKGFYVSTDDGYNAFPFIGVVKDKLVCVYSVGKNHTDNTSVDIFAKTSPNGVIWSKAKKIISTENVRDTITGLGHDSLGIIYFWNRKGTPVNADCSFDLYKTSDGIVFTKKSSPVFDIKPSHIGDALHIPTVGIISFYNTYRATRNSYGYVLTKDGGETWSQIEIASPTTQSDTPTEIYGVYIGDGKIIALGRSEDSAAMFQIQSNDYGKTWETKKTNITDVYLSTPTLIYGDDGYITVYYYNRADGKLKKRRAIASTVFENPSSWGEPSNIASGAVGQDAGNANSVKFNGNNIIAYYSGTDTETSVIDVIN